MEEVIYIEGIKEVAPVGWNGSYADEGKSQSWWLLCASQERLVKSTSSAFLLKRKWVAKKSRRDRTGGAKCP